MLMRWPLALASLLLVSASYPDKPPFEFKGYVAGESIDPARLKGCDGKGPDKRCFKRLDTLAGHEAATSIEFHDGRLTKVWVRAGKLAYPDIRRAVEEKYGEPCRRSPDTWQNALGAKLANEQLVWCFRTGELMLSPIGDSLDYMFFGYLDDVQAPPAQPKVDF